MISLPHTFQSAYIYVRVRVLPDGIFDPSARSMSIPTEILMGIPMGIPMGNYVTPFRSVSVIRSMGIYVTPFRFCHTFHGHLCNTVPFLPYAPWASM